MSEQDDREPLPDEPMTAGEILGWSEFACWTTLVLAPVLNYINGPSVSTDQAIVRAGLIALAALGTVTLRIVNWRQLGC